MSRLGPNLEVFSRCPLCGVASPNLQFKNKLAYYETSPDDDQWLAWYIYQCSKCGGPVAAQFRGPRGVIADGSPHFNHVSSTNRFIPKLDSLPSSVPKKAARYLSQAMESAHAPDGAVMLANSAVDAMLQARGLAEGSVYKRLADAVELGLITKEIREWADSIRIESNNPRHADADEPHVSNERAKLMVEFARALAEILFVLPAKALTGKSEAERLDHQ